MNERSAGAPLLWLGIAGLLISVLGGLYLGPSSAHKIEARLRSDVQNSLDDAGYGSWVSFEQVGQKAVLSGFAPSEEAKAGALDIALKSSGAGGLLLGGVTKVVDKINVDQAISVSQSQQLSYHWSARLVDGSMVLEGGAPNESARQAIIQTAEEKFEGEVIDKMAFSKRGGWEHLANLSLQHLSRFKSGEVLLVDNAFVFSGEASESAFAYLREDVNEFPRPYSVELNINTIGPDLSEIADLNLDVEGPEKTMVCQEAYQRIMALNKIYFASNRTEIDRKSGETLDKLIAISRTCSGLSLAIEGHTDDQGTRESNITLSESRAASVRNYFVARGISPDILEAAGYGPDRPADTNETPEGRANNRRIEFRVSIEEER